MAGHSSEASALTQGFSSVVGGLVDRRARVASSVTFEPGGSALESQRDATRADSGEQVIPAAEHPSRAPAGCPRDVTRAAAPTGSEGPVFRVLVRLLQVWSTSLVLPLPATVSMSWPIGKGSEQPTMLLRAPGQDFGRSRRAVAVVTLRPPKHRRR